MKDRDEQMRELEALADEILEGQEPEPELSADDIAYLKAERSEEWEERHGGGL